MLIQVTKLTLNQRVPGSSPGAPTTSTENTDTSVVARVGEMDLRVSYRIGHLLTFQYQCLEDTHLASQGVGFNGLRSAWDQRQTFVTLRQKESDILAPCSRFP